MSIPITKEGKLRLTAELERLKNTERPAIVQAIAEARAHGDFIRKCRISLRQRQAGDD